MPLSIPLAVKFDLATLGIWRISTKLRAILLPKYCQECGMKLPAPAPEW